MLKHMVHILTTSTVKVRPSSEHIDLWTGNRTVSIFFSPKRTSLLYVWICSEHQAMGSTQNC